MIEDDKGSQENGSDDEKNKNTFAKGFDHRSRFYDD